jgi:hypothetical protein
VTDRALTGAAQSQPDKPIRQVLTILRLALANSLQIKKRAHARIWAESQAILLKLAVL